MSPVVAAPPSQVNTIVDALLERLVEISAATDAAQWLTTPAVVKRGFVVADVQWPLPAILVQVARWDDSITYAGRNHTCRLTIFAHLLVNTDDPSQAEPLLNDMAADVLRALGKDHQLAGLCNMGVAATGYEPNSDAMERSGFGVATMTLEASFTWAEDAP